MVTTEPQSAAGNPNPVQAAMDLGSNSFRLLIGRQHHNGIEVLHKELITVRLAEKMNKNNMISADACARAAAAIHRFHHQLKPYRPVAIRACGTEALRRAANNKEIINLYQNIIQRPLEIINGRQEAELTLNAIEKGLSPIARPYGVIDIGGGSTEYIAAGSSPATTLAIGAVNITEKFFKKSRTRSNDIANCRHFLNHYLSQGFPDSCPMPMLAGSGGTITSLAALALNLKTYNENIVHGHRLRHQAISTIINRLASINTEERDKLPGLEKGRGQILLAGAMIIQSFLQISGNTAITVSDHGLLEGIFYSMQKTNQPNNP